MKHGLCSEKTSHVAVDDDGIAIVPHVGKGGGVTEGSPGASDPGSGSHAL